MDNLKLMMTAPHPCSYFANRDAATLFADPSAIITTDLYGSLSQYGFRRSGAYYYRPECPECQACIPARVPVFSFRSNRSQKRAIKANLDLDVLFEKEISGDEYYSLYERYINARHKDGDMYPPSREQYEGFLGSQIDATRYACFRDKHGTLLAVAVVDLLPDGLSAVYTFFDPDERQRSLGSYAVLWQIECAKTQNLPYLYLGYWIRDSQKMSYKRNFRPLEILVGANWMSID